MRYLMAASAALALLATFPVFAQDDNGITNLGTPITVTATRTPLIADQEVAPVIVITARQIQLSGAQTIGSLLQQYAGLDIAANGGPGQPTSLFLRGTNSNQTLVMINGVKINPADGSGAPLANIHLSDIERIEIVKGPRAALYGSDAIGGIINIITKQASQGTHYGAHAGAGRYGTFDNGGHFDYGQGDSAFGVSADNYHTDGFPAVAGTSFDSGNTDRSWNAYGRTAFAGLALNLQHWQSSGNTQYTQFASMPPFALAPFDENYANQTTSLDFTGHFLPDWRSNLDLSHMLDQIDQLQADPFNAQQAPDFVHTQRNVIDWQNDIALGEYQLLTAGLYSEAQHAGSESFGLAYDAPDRINALYAEDDIHAGNHRLVLAARNTHDQAFGDHLTWNADYGYDLSAATRLTAGAGTGFRAPSANERFGFGGNPDLLPETSQNIEFGLRQKIGDHQTLTLSAFRDNLDNLIQFVVTPSNLNGENENIARARVRGLEAGYTFTAKTWSWRTDAILQQPEDLNTGTRLLRRAERTFTTALDWHNDSTSLGAHLIATGPRSDLDFNTGAPLTDAGYVLAGLTLRQQFGHSFAVSASLENLLDTHYQTAAGYNTAGRSLFVRLEYQSK
ncbi:MAG: TonB-dependent receptor [Gammaproteobacteria bacterium]|nr:TonB-dependent receptor [Gammaproteobacteria bacterium]MDE2023207.1 TonB-dependent receptor [Gammaproteobacteria bacterium]MDE2272951.1 TonB-dependent receptor [Gammaproteobacteria bacterium]